MCGIAGIISTKISQEQRQSVLEKMNRAQSHRGPDDSGIYHANGISLGHVRLSILDTSTKGHQPFLDKSQNICTVLNGEIYNFLDLRKELQRDGIEFLSNSDTEVIPYLYQKKSLAFLNDLRGMFAFGLFDKIQNKFFLVRDRLGIKPVYYYFKDDVFIFASELKALLASGLIAKNLNYKALQYYMSYGYVPQPHTILQDVHALLPGQFLEYCNGKVQISSYWNLPEAQNSLESLQDAPQKLRKLLDESIQLRQISDVPLGAFLSGGIDSSAVVALMSQHVNRPVKTFSIGFSDGPQKLNEWDYARVIAKKYNTDHHEVLVNGKTVSDNLHKMVQGCDQPSFDGINTYLVSKVAKQGGLTVALSGLGGDEVFGGYTSFKTIPKIYSYFKILDKSPTFLKKTIISALSPLFSQQRKTKFSRLKHISGLTGLYSLARFNLLQNEANQMYSNDFKSQHLNNSFDVTDVLSDLLSEKQTDVWRDLSKLELFNFMTWRLLRDTDTMSMAHSLEVRVPLIDHKIIEFVFSLPLSWHNKWGFSKKLLLESLGDLLPNEIIDRPKQGFQFPMEVWMKNDLKDIVEDVFSQKTIEHRGFFDLTQMQILYKKFQNQDIAYTVIWQFVMLELWMREFID